MTDAGGRDEEENAVEHMVVVGAGRAGSRAAHELRKAGFTGEVTLLSDEAHLPYDHVPLSKDYLDGSQGHHQLFFHDGDFYEKNAIDLRLNSRVLRLNPAAQTLHLATGREVRYSAVLLATGAEPRTLSIPGARPDDRLGGVHQLRTLDDAEALRDALHEAERVAVIGSGFLGCEVAASARSLGKAVTLISRGPLPMARALGSEMAAFYRDLHVEHGTTFLASAEARELVGRDRVETVVLTDGREVAADFVVVAVGDEPRARLAEAAGLATDGGILTDASFTTSAPGVYAAGDVASVWNAAAQRYVRRPHFVTALTQGRLAARSMLGEQVRSDVVPFFFTDQFGLWMEYTGQADPDDEIMVHGDQTARRFVAFWVRDGRLTAAMNVGLKGVPDAVTHLIETGDQVSERILARIVDDAVVAK